MDDHADARENADEVGDITGGEESVDSLISIPSGFPSSATQGTIQEMDKRGSSGNPVS